MRKELQDRLHTVGRKLALANRLRKVAIASEEEMIDRMALRSKKVVLDVRGQLSKLVSEVEGRLPAEEEKRVLSQVANEVYSSVTESGEANRTQALKTRKSLKSYWEKVNYGKYRKVVLSVFTSFDKFLLAVSSVAALQHPQLVEKAKSSPAFREKYYENMELLVGKVQEVHKATQAVSELLSARAKQQEASTPTPATKPPQAAAPQEAPPKPEDTKKTVTDSTAEEAVSSQLDAIEQDMREVVGQLSRFIRTKTSDLFGRDSKLSQIIEENVFAIYNNKVVTPALNRDTGFYQESLHLEQGRTSVDLKTFLDTKRKKSIYLSYRSFVMAARALGVIQYAKSRPDLVISNPKIHDMAVKAQKILKKRSNSIVSLLRGMKKTDQEEAKDEETGIPSGTFSDHFESR